MSVTCENNVRVPPEGLNPRFEICNSAKRILFTKISEPSLLATINCCEEIITKVEKISKYFLKLY